MSAFARIHEKLLRDTLAEMPDTLGATLEETPDRWLEFMARPDVQEIAKDNSLDLHGSMEDRATLLKMYFVDEFDFWYACKADPDIDPDWMDYHRQYRDMKFEEGSAQVVETLLGRYPWMSCITKRVWADE